MTAKVPGTRKRPQLYVGTPPIPDDATDEIKDALAARAVSWVQGECPSCGCTPEFDFHPELGVASVSFWHLAGCPVSLVLDQEREP